MNKGAVILASFLGVIALFAIGAYVKGAPTPDASPAGPETLTACGTPSLTVYTFWGKTQCPIGWKLIQRGVAATQYNSFGSTHLSGDTICLDNELWFEYVPAGEFGNPEFGAKETGFPLQARRYYENVSCVVCGIR